MSVNRLTIVLTILFVGMDCRSTSSTNSNRSSEIDNDDIVNLPNVDDVANDFPGERLMVVEGVNGEKSLAEYVAKTNATDDEDEAADQWLNKLESALNSLENEKQINESEMNYHEANRSFVLIGGDNWVEDLQEFLDEQYGETEISEDDNETYVKSSENLQRNPEELDDTVGAFQNDVSDIRRYFRKLCRKHRTAS